MIDTKLILIEGPPGSGKSTTAQKLAEEITRSGRACRCYLEWDNDHPLPIGEDIRLGEVIASSRARESSMLQDWQQFTQTRQSQEIVTVMESRFWQTSVMLMYAAGLPAAGILASNQRVIAAIQDLKPVLIYFAIDDPRLFAARTVRIKNEEWLKSGIPGTWAQFIFDAFDTQFWLTQRGLTGLEGILAFLEEWAQVTEELYDRVPFSKVKIKNPHRDWSSAMQLMRDFLDLGW